MYRLFFHFPFSLFPFRLTLLARRRLDVVDGLAPNLLARVGATAGEADDGSGQRAAAAAGAGKDLGAGAHGN